MDLLSATWATDAASSDVMEKLAKSLSNTSGMNINMNMTEPPTSPPATPGLFTPRRISTMPTYQLIIFCIFIIVGLLGNTANVWTFSRLKHTSMHILLQGLAVYDIIFLLFLISGCVYRSQGYHRSLVAAYINLLGYSLLSLACARASTLLTALSSIDRLIHITLPLRAASICTKARARYTVIGCFLLSLALQIPGVSVARFRPFTTSEGTTIWTVQYLDWYYSNNYDGFLLFCAVLYEYAPPIVMIITSLALLIALRDYEARRQKLFASTPAATANSSGSRHSDRRLTYTLIVLIAINIVCNAPLTLIRMLPLPRAASAVARSVFAIFYVFEHCCSFFIYMLMNSNFRQEFKLGLSCHVKSDPNSSLPTKRTTIKSTSKESGEGA